MADKKGITLSEIKKVAGEAISYFNINKHIDFFEEDELMSLCKNGDPSIFNDRSIADNEIVRMNLNWSKVKAKKLCRIMARFIDIGQAHLLDDIDTKNMNIRVRDIRSILRREPSLIERFNVDLKKISDMDAHVLLEMGSPYFLQHITIKGRAFTSIQQYDICKAYAYDRNVLSMFNCQNFDGFQTKEILKVTGKRDLDILNINCLKLVDWIDLLAEAPYLYSECRPELYSQDPILQLITLAVISNDDKVFSIIRSKDLNEVSPYGWEKLMSNRPEMFKDVCDYTKLDALNKRKVLVAYPQFMNMME